MALYNYSITPDSIARGWQKLGYAKQIRLNVLRPEDNHSFSVSDIAALDKRQTEALWYYAVGSLALDDGNRWRALLFFLKSLLKNPLHWHALMKTGAALLPVSLANLILNRVKKLMESSDAR
jgi:hypothetical protein